jgi:hypothetical protein
LSSPNGAAGQDAHTRSFWERHSDRILGASVLLVLLIGTLAYSVLEDWSLLDSFYFSSVALTAVGFGDLTPSTDLSKIFTVFYIFSGVAIVGMWLNMRLKRRTKKVAHRRHSGFDHTPDAATDGRPEPEPPMPPTSEG